MVVIARARMLPSSEADSLLPLARTLVFQAPSKEYPEFSDPLCEWFTEPTAGTIRQLELSIRHSTVGQMVLAAPAADVSRISGLTATLYLALFAACRSLTASFRSTNPTWIRQPKTEEAKTVASRPEIEAAFLQNVELMASTLARTSAEITPRWKIEIGDTTAIKSEGELADAVVTSPPYCTRIDYTAATRIELAILAPLISSARQDLSSKMIGSIRVPNGDIEPSDRWGAACNKFLKEVQAHPSKASATYYYKTHLDYFDKIYRSIGNLSGFVKPGGMAFIVVQDSYYKNIHNDLPRIISEMSDANGFALRRRENFVQSRSMVSVNKYTKLYRRPSAPTESVLCLERIIDG